MLNLVHEALTESIAGKADDDHDHSGIYSPFDHGHENLATDDHAHDEYQPKGDYADSVHIHTEYAETGDIEELSAAIAEEAKDRANADSILQDQVTANKESIEAISEKGYDDSWIQPALDKKSDDPHTHDDLASGITHMMNILLLLIYPMELMTTPKSKQTSKQTRKALRHWVKRVMMTQG